MTHFSHADSGAAVPTHAPLGSDSPVGEVGGISGAGVSAAVERRRELDRLYAQHARMVYAVALAYLSPTDAEDVVQDVFLKAFDRLDERRDPERSGPWLAAIARTVAIDRHRQSARERRKIDAMKTFDPRVHEQSPTASPLTATLEASDVLDAIRRLPEAYREPLILRLVEGLTGPQIADQLGMTHGSVRVNLCTGMKQLRQLLGWEGAQ